MTPEIMDILDSARVVAGSIALGLGLAFVLIGTIGVLRFPDFYTRLHAAGVTDTLGAELMLLGLMLQADSILTAAKLALIGLFLFLTSPTATHALANAAHTAGLKPLLKRPKKPAATASGAGKPA
jgi:multicomponent Na+:H+ antiporter subunit G